MRAFLRLLILFGLQFSLSSYAAVVAVQVNSDTDVFTKPNFRSPVIEKLETGTVLSMSTNKVVGAGGLGIFYKVKTPSGKIGYIVDSDIVLTGAGLPKQPPPPAAAAPQPPPPPPVKENPASSAWGLSLGAANYTDNFEGKKYSASQLFFGGRWSGNFETLWLDAGLLLSPNAPKFLSAAGASGQTKGLEVLTDVSWNYSFLKMANFSFYGGAGPLLAFSQYSTQYNGATKEHSKVNFGGVADLGTALDFSTGRARFDLRYFFAGSGYVGAFVTVQLFL